MLATSLLSALPSRAEDAGQLEQQAAQHFAAGRLRLAGDTYRQAYARSHDATDLKHAIDAYLAIGFGGKALARDAAQELLQHAATLEDAEAAQALIARIEAIPPDAPPAPAQPAAPAQPPAALPAPAAAFPNLAPGAIAPGAPPSALVGARVVVRLTNGSDVSGELTEVRWGESLDIRTSNAAAPTHLEWDQILDLRLETQPPAPTRSWQERGAFHLGYALRGLLIGALTQTTVRSEIRPNSGPGYLLQSKVPVGGIGIGIGGDLAIHYLAMPREAQSGIVFGLRAGAGLAAAGMLVAKNDASSGFSAGGQLAYEVPLFVGGQVLFGSFRDRATWKGAAFGVDLLAAYRSFGVEGADGDFALPGVRATLDFMTLKVQHKRDSGLELFLELAPRTKTQPLVTEIGIGSAWF